MKTRYSHAEASGPFRADQIRDRIRACEDLEVLDRWIVRASTAAGAAEVVAEP
ncbi:MAG: hypothetical protein GY856_28490 [bacterium]|nr:hypothetical protein [bacterium]